MNAVEVNHQKSKILLEDPQNRILINHVASTPLHNHLYSEIHIILAGEAHFTIDGTEYKTYENDTILIPPHRYHAVNAEKNASRICFYTDYAANEIAQKRLAEGFVSEMREKLAENAYIASVCNHLLFILNELASRKELRCAPLNDYKLQIREFFSLNYNKKIVLGDLASKLHLSTMQTQRVIKKYTGKTFGENLLIQRMTVAENLIQTTDMSLSAIAEYVGYESYCGFWKARKQYLSLINTEESNPTVQTQHA